jgi:hypothetical protein
MCRVLGVTRSGYYSYQRRNANKPMDPEHQQMLHWVREIAKASDYSYGSPVITVPVPRRLNYFLVPTVVAGAQAFLVGGIQMRE